MNPWRITKGQAAILDALVESGNQKAAAKNLGLSIYTVTEHVSEIRKRMGCARDGSRYSHLLTWDRWRRESKEQA